MANTERLKVIKLVREAKIIADDYRFDKSLDSSKQEIFEELYIKLDEIEDKLIIEDITTGTKALIQTTKDLKKINDSIKEKIKDLEGIAKKVDNVSDAIKGLVDVVVFAATL